MAVLNGYHFFTVHALISANSCWCICQLTVNCLIHSAHTQRPGFALEFRLNCFLERRLAANFVSFYFILKAVCVLLIKLVLNCSRGVCSVRSLGFCSRDSHVVPKKYTLKRECESHAVRSPLYSKDPSKVIRSGLSCTFYANELNRWVCLLIAPTKSHHKWLNKPWIHSKGKSANYKYPGMGDSSTEYW